jgi:GT2 family glycosyltransferase
VSAARGDTAVVIGNYEGAGVLPDLFESLRRQTLPPVETILVDAGSRDASRELARRYQARVIETANRGLGHLYNRGAAEASADLVFLANNDLVLEPACLERLAEALEEDPALFAADARQVRWSDGEQIHARTVLRRGRLRDRHPLPGLEIDPNVPADGVVPTLTANGGAMLVRRRLLLELGGFDETFFMDFEDIDLCWRAWLRGHGSVYVPSACVRHRVGAVTGASESPRRLASSHHNLLRFALKCLPAGPAARVVAGELARLPVHGRPLAGALARVARDLPAILRERRRLRARRAVYDWLVAGQPGPPP